MKKYKKIVMITLIAKLASQQMKQMKWNFRKDVNLDWFELYELLRILHILLLFKNKYFHFIL